MKALILERVAENIRWVPLPCMVILFVFLIDKADEPMLGPTDTYFFCLTAVMFGATLGFVQIFFESHGDKRSILLHRPLSPSRIFLAKALAGVGLLRARAWEFLSGVCKAGTRRRGRCRRLISGRRDFPG